MDQSPLLPHTQEGASATTGQLVRMETHTPKGMGRSFRAKHDLMDRFSIPGDALQVIAARGDDHHRESVALQAAMQSLVLDASHPIALEISGSTTEKRFVIRATKFAALEHARAQIHARYPQAQFRFICPEMDHFAVRAKEAVTVVELRAGAPSYLPMKEVAHRELEQQGGDPILGVLAALKLPPGMRAVAQMALVPAPSAWSRAHLRKAFEHPMEQERLRQYQQRQQAGGPSTLGLGCMGLILIGLVLVLRFPQILPPWLLPDLLTVLVKRHPPELSSEQTSWLFGWGAAILIGGSGLFFGAVFLRRLWGGQPLYEPRQVERKTSQMAYRVRLRLYAIGPGPHYRYRFLARLFLLRWWQALRPARYWVVAMVRPRWNRISHPGQWWSMRIDWVRWLGQQTLAWVCVPSRWRNDIQALAYWLWQITCHLRVRLFQEGYRWWRRIRLYCRTAKRERKWRKQQRIVRSSILASLVAAYRQFDTASAGYFVTRTLPWWKASWLLAPATKPWKGWERDIARSKHYVTGDFLSLAWRFPSAAMVAEVPLLQQKRARSLLLSTELIAPAHLPIIGYSEHGGYRLPFALTETFLHHHSLIGGKSGAGKSTLMAHLAHRVMLREEGALCVIDPHGDLADDILSLVPPARMDEVVFIDLGNKTTAVGINPLDVQLQRDRDLAISTLMQIFEKVWEHAGWGNRMAASFRMALLTLYEANEALCQRNCPHQQYTLLDVMQLLVDESFCHDLLKEVQDPFVHRFWYEYFEPLDLRQQRERIDPVITKLIQFERKTARRILGQSRSTIHFHQAVTNRAILIIRLASSEVGDDTAALLGSTLLGFILSALREQGSQQGEPMPIIIDEFQTMPGSNYALLLAEMRKFGAAAILATQSFEYLHKLDHALLPTVLANVQQLMIYGMSAADAWTIHRELGVSAEDIISLDQYECYIKMSHAGRQMPPFSLHVMPPPQGSSVIADAIRARCRLHYGRDVAEVDEALRNAQGRAISASTHRLAEEAAKKDRSSASKSGKRGSSREDSSEEPQEPQPAKGAWAPKGRNKRPRVQPLDLYPDEPSGRQEERGDVQSTQQEQGAPAPDA